MREAFKNSHHRIRLQMWGRCFNEIEYQKNLFKMGEDDSRIEFKIPKLSPQSIRNIHYPLRIEDEAFDKKLVYN
jgi:hypothetical protein